MSESSSSEEQIFEKALALPSAERLRFLDEACRGDDDLRMRIDALLRAHDSGGSFMSRQALAGGGPVGGSASVGMDTEGEGSMIGRYKLLQKLGEGGCGVVWMADQEDPVRRRVALKIIKLGMDTKEVIARFDAERQALAMMDHPNIAKILDAGATDSGRPFFVMELVRGKKITEFCDQFNLSTVQRLELFSLVCHAIQHAHQKGIIHRDLKPSNILVTLNDGVPVPKVIDFGIAKATEGRLTDHTLFTAFEQFIGTPAYMSPEQAELSGIDVDTRSDIYSLGVLLYELLTGRPPFDPKSLHRAGLDEIRRIIREVDPPRPSTNLSTLADADRAQVARLRGTDAARLSLLLRGDLDWIVMRCLEKNRTRRYETPNALVADIERHLNNEPVVARPPTRLYRLNRLVRRNRLAFVAAFSVAMALIAGLAISTWQAVRATRAERLADIERSDAVAERTRAEDLLKFMLGDLYTQLYKVGRLDVLEAVADKATAYFASLSPGDLGDTTQFSRARALRLLGGVRVSQSRFADALAAFSGAYERAADLTARHPKDPEALFERGQAEFGIGLVHWRRAEYSEAGDWLTRYRDTCAALVDLEPARQDRQRDLLDGQHNLAALREERGELAAAQSEFLAELASLEKMGASDPADLDLRIRQADTNAELGSIAEQRGDLAESLKRYSAQEAHLEYVTLADPKTETWRQSQAKALLLEESIDLVIGQYSAAGELLAKAQKLLEAQVARDPANLDWKGVFLYARMAEAVLSRRQGDVAAATRYVDEVLPQFEAIAASEPTDHVIAMMVLKAWRLKAQLQAADGRADATNSALQAVGIGERLSRAGGLTDGEIGECARAYVVAGDIAARNGDDGGARRDYLRAAELVAPLLAATSYWQVLDPAARSAAALGRSAEARAAIEKLNLLGYVPVDPWPELERPGAAKISEQQPK